MEEFKVLWKKNDIKFVHVSTKSKKLLCKKISFQLKQLVEISRTLSLCTCRDTCAEVPPHKRPVHAGKKDVNMHSGCDSEHVSAF